MPRSGPFSPVFKVKKRRGHINPGTQIGETPIVPPPLLDTLSAFIGFSDIVAVGDFLYVTSPSDNECYAIDKTDPSNLGAPDDFGTVSWRPIAALGTHVYVVQGGELRAWSLAVPGTPSLVGSTSTGASISNANGMTVSGGRVYVTNNPSDRLYNFDVSTPTAPTLTDTLTDGTDLNGALGVAFQGSHVYVACEDGGRLTSVDISVPATMAVADTETHADLTAATDAAINLQYVYAISPTGLIVVDKTTPTALSYVTTVSIPDAIKVEVGGDHAFVLTDDGAGNADLIVLDITNPAAPAVIPQATVTGVGGTDLVLDDDVLFVTSEGDGAIKAYDVLAFP